MRRVLLISLLALGATKPPPNSSPPLAPPPPPRDSVLDNRPSQSVWRQIQPEVDRSTGRIVDEPSYQLDHLQPPIPSERFKQFMEEHDRQMRLDQRAQQQQKTAKQLSREELDRREYELFINAGLSSMSLQAMADEQALNNVKAIRDQQLLDAQNEEATALRQRPGNRQEIEAAYLKKAQGIRGRYENERQRILGYSEPPPTTQP